MRAEYYYDHGRPDAQAFLPAAFAITRDPAGRLLLVRRADDRLWELPGGRLELGESAADAVVREVAEEAGIEIKPTAISGVYSDPEHVLAYPEEGAYQQLAICFHAFAVTDQPPRPDQDETTEAAWFSPDQLPELPIHPAVRRRINDTLTQPALTHFD